MIILMQHSSSVLHLIESEVKDHFFSLSERDRYLRFGYKIRDPQLEEFVERSLSDSNTMWFAAYDIDPMSPWNRKLIGLAQLCTDKKGHDAELGISVIEQYRCDGIASKLMKKAFRRASMASVHRVHILTLMENKAMQRLAHKFGVKFGIPEMTEIEGVSELDYSSFDMGSHFFDECYEIEENTLNYGIEMLHKMDPFYDRKAG